MARHSFNFHIHVQLFYYYYKAIMWSWAASAVTTSGRQAEDNDDRVRFYRLLEVGNLKKL